MWTYTTAAVTSHFYGTSDTTSLLYNEGADWVGVSFSVYNGFAAIIAFTLPVVAKWTSRKVVHVISLLAGGAGLAGIYLISDPWMLLIPMLGIGLAWGSIFGNALCDTLGSHSRFQDGRLYGIVQFLYRHTANCCRQYPWNNAS